MNVKKDSDGNTPALNPISQRSATTPQIALSPVPPIAAAVAPPSLVPRSAAVEAVAVGGVDVEAAVAGVLFGGGAAMRRSRASSASCLFRAQGVQTGGGGGEEVRLGRFFLRVPKFWLVSVAAAQPVPSPSLRSAGFPRHTMAFGELISLPKTSAEK